MALAAGRLDRVPAGEGESGGATCLLRGVTGRSAGKPCRLIGSRIVGRRSENPNNLDVPSHKEVLSSFKENAEACLRALVRLLEAACHASAPPLTAAEA